MLLSDSLKPQYVKYVITRQAIEGLSPHSPILSHHFQGLTRPTTSPQVSRCYNKSQDSDAMVTHCQTCSD